jgi:hypothetical protein
MFAVMTLLSWIGFIQFLRYSKSTRILTAHIVQSTKAMIPFLPVIFIVLTAFSLTFWIHENAAYEHFDEENPDAQSGGIQSEYIYFFFENQYKLMFADFDAFENRDVFTILLLLFATILVPLVFLNLLIALISEAFATVVENLIRSDYSELTDIILELEEFMFWNINDNGATHLVVAQHS